jgi:hypothetical protein
MKLMKIGGKVMDKFKIFKQFIILSTAILLFGWSSGVFAAGLVSAVQSGADHILTIQNTNGSFTWPHGPSTAGPGHKNITGPIGMGLLNAYGMTGDVDHRTGATSAADFLNAQTFGWVGTYNPFFMLKTYDVTGTTAYKDKATEYFTQLTAGTYTGSNGVTTFNTAGYISAVQSGRSGSFINLRPWEFATLAYSAQREGSPSQQAAFLTALTDGINTLDNSNPGSVWWDMLGLSGGVFGLGLTGTDFDPTAGSFASANSTSDLADILAGFQNLNGSWYWSSNLGSPDTSDEDAQTTAYAMLALMSVNTFGQYNDEITKGRNYLLGTQLTSGGFPSYPGGTENIEVEGEVVWALTAPQIIDVDIKPGSCPNPFNVKSKGMLPIAILGKADFDVRTIDVGTLVLNGIAPIKTGFEDVTTPASKIDPCDCEALDGDAYEDLVLKFDRQDILATLGVVNEGDVVQLTLTGYLLEASGGTPILGSDCVLIKAK